MNGVNQNRVLFDVEALSLLPKGLPFSAGNESKGVGIVSTFRTTAFYCRGPLLVDGSGPSVASLPPESGTTKNATQIYE